MTNKKSTKRALLVSAMAMVICFTMLLGTTFAWFTDSETSRNNIIKSGNLDISFEYFNETANAWQTVEENTSKLFDDAALWEPGYTDVVYVRVKNVGTLALNYQLGMNIYNETTSTNVDNGTLKLSSYIRYGIVKLTGDVKYANADDAIAAIPTGTAYTLESKYTSAVTPLEAGADFDYYAIVVFMPDDIGNEANYKLGADVPTIKLGVNVSATQKASEKDHFDTNYDATAPVPDTTVNP